MSSNKDASDQGKKICNMDTSEHRTEQLEDEPLSSARLRKTLVQQLDLSSGHIPPAYKNMKSCPIRRLDNTYKLQSIRRTGKKVEAKINICWLKLKPHKRHQVLFCSYSRPAISKEKQLQLVTSHHRL